MGESPNLWIFVFVVQTLPAKAFLALGFLDESRSQPTWRQEVVLGCRCQGPLGLAFGIPLPRVFEQVSNATQKDSVDLPLRSLGSLFLRVCPKNCGLMNVPRDVNGFNGL